MADSVNIRKSSGRKNCKRKRCKATEISVNRSLSFNIVHTQNVLSRTFVMLSPFLQPELRRKNWTGSFI